jgi:SAM-dependent methyltransferase
MSRIKSNSNNYFLPKNYISNKSNFSLDINRESKYWSKERIKSSYSFQFHTYKLLSSMVNYDNTVLDIGCGYGLKLNQLIREKTTNYVGIDQQDAIDYCKSNYSTGEYFSVDLENPEIKLNRNFDFIICSDVIEHLLNPDNLLELIKNNASESTKIILSTPCRIRLRGLDNNKSLKKDHVREWAKNELINYLESSGFLVESTKLHPPFKIFLNNLKFSFKFISKRLINHKKGMHFFYNHTLILRVK